MSNIYNHNGMKPELRETEKITIYRLGSTLLSNQCQ